MADILKPDLCILGAGAAGIALAIAARDHGASVVMIDLGAPGDSLKSGPVPSAALAAAAATAHNLRNATSFGMGNGDPKVNFRGVHEFIQSTIAAIAPREAAERLRALGIEMLAAPAAFVDKRTVKAGETLIRARRFVIASGSNPVVPPIKNLGEVPFFSTDTIFANTYKLSHLVILGGGALGLEFAQSYRRLGCEVTVVEASSALAEVDSEAAEMTLRRLREEGVIIHERSVVTEMVPRSQGIGVMIRHEDGTEATLDASHILLAVGRTPNFGGLALDKAGIRFDKGNADRLLLRPKLLTSNGRVHVIGEAAGSPPSLPAAQHDAHVVLESALFNRTIKRAPTDIPVTVFTDPQVAQIGVTEAAAKLRLKGAYKVIRASFSENDRAIAMRRSAGIAKLITDRHGAILGAAIAGPEAGELIAFFGLAIRHGIRLPDLADAVAPYPSFTGIVGQLVEAWRQQAGAEPWRQRRLALVRRLP
ncbi:MAG: Mercuric ion reductase [Devosia sp.]|uniref:dihydrolipoyl dehydrogenase family protein n=1 Tax=Devosia sp. TaxID=1871048 RepID=UPI00260531D8|nr:NAD(P)/FAD-dependent oxidoreductase [Devosia sp.]MDB5588848.1 Mercuric ion reductase [Devosia sp.]